ncbi:protein of unknown function [Burkholderia multivorans]
MVLGTEFSISWNRTTSQNVETISTRRDFNISTMKLVDNFLRPRFNVTIMNDMIKIDTDHITANN